MALPLPKGKEFSITKRHLPSDYEMPSMEVASDHYEIGFLIEGDRRIITPTGTYSVHSGYISSIAPFIYHRTISLSTKEYISILMKFTPDFVKPFNDILGPQIIDSLFTNPLRTFSEKDREKIFDLANELLCDYDDIGEYFEDNTYKRFKIQNKLFRLLMEIYEKGIIDEKNSSVHNAPLSESILEAVYYIEKNYKNDIKIEDVAEISGYSVSYFSRLFNSQIGIPFSEYLCVTRLKHVQHMLLKTDKSVMDIALECGFSYPGNMTSSFKSKFGMTPLQFRKNQP